jgi:hypothetical protein
MSLSSKHDAAELKDEQREHSSFNPTIVMSEVVGSQLQDSSEDQAIKEKRLLRKLDMRLLPTIALIYILNYIDVGPSSVILTSFFDAQSILARSSHNCTRPGVRGRPEADR